MKISIIVPVYNEAELIKKCLRALINQDYPKKDYEIIVVNDGSTDKTLDSIRKRQKDAKEENVTLRIINLKKNGGRIVARETGAKMARYSNLLFIDSRCLANKNILSKIKKINYQPIVANIFMNSKRSNLDRFGLLFRKKLYPGYSTEDFKPFFITEKKFDDFPKGTTTFFCNKNLFLSSRLKLKEKFSSDDPKLLWNIIKKKKILKHPNLKITYLSRVSLTGEIIHAFWRGPLFVDFYLDLSKKRFWQFIFLPASILIFTVILIFINPAIFLYWLGSLIILWIFISIWLSENFKDLVIVLRFLPIIGLSFWSGIMYGLLLKVLRKY